MLMLSIAKSNQTDKQSQLLIMAAIARVPFILLLSLYLVLAASQSKHISPITEYIVKQTIDARLHNSTPIFESQLNDLCVAIRRDLNSMLASEFGLEYEDWTVAVRAHHAKDYFECKRVRRGFFRSKIEVMVPFWKSVHQESWGWINIVNENGVSVWAGKSLDSDEFYW